MDILNINNKDYEIDLKGHETLLEILRDELGFTGTKTACSEAECGACSVIINEKSVLSCITLAKNCIGKKITTIEGLSENGDHPMQQAWVDKNVPQCGYCQSGQIMNAAALLKAIPNPSEQEIIDGMSGNICRCGTYNRIKEAIQLAAKK